MWEQSTKAEELESEFVLCSEQMLAVGGEVCPEGSRQVGNAREQILQTRVFVGEYLE